MRHPLEELLTIMVIAVIGYYLLLMCLSVL